MGSPSAPYDGLPRRAVRYASHLMVGVPRIADSRGTPILVCAHATPSQGALPMRALTVVAVLLASGAQSLYAQHGGQIEIGGGCPHNRDQKRFPAPHPMCARGPLAACPCYTTSLT